MPSDTSLKVLIALNAVQIFITLLLVATMASTGINAKSAEAGYGGLSSRSSSAGSDPYGDAAPSNLGTGSAALPPGEESAPAAPIPAADPSVDVAAAPEVDEEAEAEEKAKRNQVILRTYLNLVSRRLDIAATDEGVDPEPYLPTDGEITAAIESGSADSEAFTLALDKLRAGYEALKMDFPEPPGSKGKGSEQ